MFSGLGFRVRVGRGLRLGVLGFSFEFTALGARVSRVSGQRFKGISSRMVRGVGLVDQLLVNSGFFPSTFFLSSAQDRTWC